MREPFAWVPVYLAADSVEANIVKGLLQNSGIDCQVYGEALAGALGEIPQPETWVKVLVYEIKQRLAEQILLEYRQRKELAPDWYCSVCGEANGAAFDLCWSCMAENNEKTQ